MATATGAERTDDLEVLEGDEGELEVGRHHDVGHELLETPLAAIKLPAAAVVRADTPVARAIEAMRGGKTSAVLVVDRNRTRRLVGIFTEHDLVTRALPSRGWANAPVSRFMTRSPETLRTDDPVAYAVNRMSAGGFRHVPLVDREGRPTGLVSATELVAYLVELCPEELLNLPPEPGLALHAKPEGE